MSRETEVEQPNNFPKKFQSRARKEAVLHRGYCVTELSGETRPRTAFVMSRRSPLPYGRGSELNTNYNTTVCAIALGTEAEGLFPIWQRKEVQPVLGVVDSFNVAIATILFYEARRQKSKREA